MVRNLPKAAVHMKKATRGGTLDLQTVLHGKEEGSHYSNAFGPPNSTAWKGKGFTLQ